MKNTKILSYLTLVLGSVLVVVAFLTAKNYTQLGVAIILYPIVTFFAFKLFPRRKRVPIQQAVFTNPNPTPVAAGAPAYQTTNSETFLEEEEGEIEDGDRRSFLKLVGTMGVALFLTSLVGERFGNMLFGKSLITGGQTQGGPSPAPATVIQNSSPTDGYKITEADETDIVSYYGFTNEQGNWLIMKNDAENNSFRYSKGDTNFPGNWAGRSTLRYDYFYNLAK